jgi:hypothetical protein
MERRRHDPESKALQFLRQRTDASAFEIDAAAIRSEPCAQRVGWRGKEAIGLLLAAELVRRGLASATFRNRFMGT